MASDAVDYQIWAVPQEDAITLQACPELLVAWIGTCDDSVPQHFLTTNNNARRNAWKYLTEQHEWDEKLFPPHKHILPCENNNLIINIFFRIQWY